MSKPMYRLVDGKGRVLIPKSMREAAKLEYGDIVCLGMAGGKITVRKVEVIEVGARLKKILRPPCAGL